MSFQSFASCYSCELVLESVCVLFSLHAVPIQFTYGTRFTLRKGEGGNGQNYGYFSLTSHAVSVLFVPRIWFPIPQSVSQKRCVCYVHITRKKKESFRRHGIFGPMLREKQNGTQHTLLTTHESVCVMRHDVTTRPCRSCTNMRRYFGGRARLNYMARV